MKTKNIEAQLRESQNPQIQNFFLKLDACTTCRDVRKVEYLLPLWTPGTSEEYDQYVVMNHICFAKQVEIKKIEKEKKQAAIKAKKEERQARTTSLQKKVNSSPIKAIVEPLRNDAMDRAEDFARQLIDHRKAELEICNFDLNSVAPYPSHRLSRESYATSLSRYRFYRSICKPRPGNSNKFGDPAYADINDEMVKKYIADTRKDAAAQYDDFITKLVNKIGEVSEATLQGNHVWSYSILTVKLSATGEVQNWKTQTIINMSKLGKLFNQWPTRKVK